MLKNNKGQVLVLFVIFIPIFFIMLGMVINLGYLSLEEKKINNSTKDALKYYLDNLDDTLVYDKSYDLLSKNVKDSDIKIIDSPMSVEVTVIKTIKNKYGLNDKKQDIMVVYKGYKDDKRIVKGWFYGFK